MSSSRPSDSRPRLPFVPRSLTARLTVTAIALVAVVSVVVAAVTTLALREFLLKRLDDQLEAAARGVQAVYSAPGAQAVQCPAAGVRVIGPSPADLVGVLDPPCRAAQVSKFDEAHGAFMSVRVSESDLRELDDVPIDTPTTVHITGAGEYRVLVLDDSGQRVVAGVSTRDVSATVSRLIGWEALVALLGVLAAAAAATYAVRRQLRPLNAVAATAREVAAQPLDSGAVAPLAKVPDLADPQTEVGQVADALNRMLRHVERAFASRHASEQQTRQFLADASHELRTPLATIQGYAQLSQRRGASDEKALRHAMSKVEVESERMAELVDDLLLLARLDAGRPLDESEVDVTRLVVEAVNDARVVDGERRWRLSIPDESVAVVGDRQRLHQVVTNLLSNARRHTPPGTTVTVSAAARSDGGAQITVSDDGPGMPEALRGHEFDRFTRGDTSRTRTSGGAGLGLSIVKAIVDAHGGSVSVDSAPSETVFTIALPVTPPHTHSDATGPTYP